MTEGSTQYDGLAHVRYDGEIWSGYDARTTIGGLDEAGVEPIAQRGVVSRAVLLDMARFRGRDTLDEGETSTHEDLKVPNLATDTIADEVTFDPDTGVALVLHNALMRDLGVTLTEIADLEQFAADCAEDGRYAFLHVAAPLEVARGSGSPVNSVVIE